MFVVYFLQNEILEIKLSTLTVIGMCDLLDKVEDLNPQMLSTYKGIIKDNNINGKVLMHCDLQELKNVLRMSFGDWEIFRMIIVSLREQELTSFTTHEENLRSVRFTVGLDQKKGIFFLLAKFINQ